MGCDGVIYRTQAPFPPNRKSRPVRLKNRCSLPIRVLTKKEPGGFEHLSDQAVHSRMPSYRSMRALAVLGWLFAHLTGHAEPVAPDATLQNGRSQVLTRHLLEPQESKPAPSDADSDRCEKR
jgi:hypothetical protein